MNSPTGPSEENKVTIKRIGRSRILHSIIPILDSSGKVIERIAKPLMVEIHARDVMQVIVGATLLAIPLSYTEETWNLGEKLPLGNIVALVALSVLFVALFVYLNFYKDYLKEFLAEYIQRVLMIYLLTLIVVAALMTLIDQCPWQTDWVLAMKRIIIVAFPASLSATLTDTIK
jgi:uncharacterized membrane protein